MAYAMEPHAHITAAEKYADAADTDRFQADTDWRQLQATLALAHAQIASAIIASRGPMT